MLEYFVKQFALFVITIMLLYVPDREKLEQELKRLPSVEDRIQGMDLKGWRLQKCVSQKTGMTYTYFYYPSLHPGVKNLVCLHGFNTDGRLFLNLKDLATSFNLIAFNLPESTSFYTGMLSDFDEVLNDYLTAMHLDSILLMGVSLGGIIGIHYAASNPEVAVSNLILVSTTVFGGSEKTTQDIQRFAKKLLRYPDYKLYYLMLRGRKIFGNLARAELGQEQPKKTVTMKHIDWYRQVLKSVYWYNGVEDAKRIHCPVIVVHGDKDKLIKLEDAQLIRTLMPQAQWHLLSGKGHAMVNTDGKDIASLIKRDLQVE